jgi:hypothetical protein
MQSFGVRYNVLSSRTPGRASTRIALHTRPIPNQREVAALAAHLALVAFCLGFGAAFGLGRGGGLGAAGLAPLQGFQLFGRRESCWASCFSATAPSTASPAREVAPCEASAVTRPPALSEEAGIEPPRMMTRLSVRERVRPFDKYFVAWWPWLSSGSLPSSTPLPSASKLVSLG